MRRAAVIEPNGTSKRSTVATVVTICTRRKKSRAPLPATAVSLPKATQEDVQAAWIGRLQTLPPVMRADSYYAGRGFAIARDVAEKLAGKLYVASAGLGLVPGEREVPSYGMTVSGTGPDAISKRVAGQFEAATWFAAMLSGSYSDQWTDVFAQGDGRVLVALTRTYAEMVGEELAALPARMRSRLRIFGSSLDEILPKSLTQNISPHDDRLDAVIPGTKADFPQRALLHFVQIVGDARGDCLSDYALITKSLKRVKAPERPVRPRCSDQELLQLIASHLKEQSGIARVLRAVRHDSGIACEQSRVTRLYRAAVRQVSS